MAVASHMTSFNPPNCLFYFYQLCYNLFMTLASAGDIFLASKTYRESTQNEIRSHSGGFLFLQAWSLLPDVADFAGV